MQPMPRHDVEQILDGQRTQLLALQMISGHQMPLLASRDQELTGRTVVQAVGQELQREERMGGAAPAQIELNGVGRPLAGAVPLHDEVDREPTQGTLSCQPLANSDRRLTDQSRVGRVRRKDAAKVALSTGASEKLIMSGQQFYAPVREYSKLDARTVQLLAYDPLLDDPAVLLELRLVCGKRRNSQFQLH